jgi:DNA-binding beta-propeller fold protein YncE
VANQGDNTVSVINAATCNAQNTSGCNQTPPTVAVNDSPYGLAVDEHTNTVYVANTGNEIFQTGYANLTSSVSIINGAACNATRTSGCGQTPTSVRVGGLPWDVAVDPATNGVYVTSIVDSDVAVINGAACNGQITSDCSPRVIPAKPGGWPSDIGLDHASGTMYVTDNVDGAMSLFRLRRR